MNANRAARAQRAEASAPSAVNGENHKNSGKINRRIARPAHANRRPDIMQSQADIEQQQGGKDGGSVAQALPNRGGVWHGGSMPGNYGTSKGLVEGSNGLAASLAASGHGVKSGG